MVADNIRHILDDVEAACLRLGRRTDSIRLIAVGKTFPTEVILEAVDAGIVDIGENYVQEAVSKRALAADRRIRWHFIGHLQTNKVKYIAEWVSMIQSVDNFRCAQEIQKHAARFGRRIDVLVEVNTSEEATKFGVKPHQAVEFVHSLEALPNIVVKGLMTIGPFTDQADESRTSFRLLKKIFDEINLAGRITLTELSMGMTHDYPIAIEEGATMIRIGTAIFGTRAKKS